jgi:apolipoprotein N-acyltransferase
VPNPKSKIQNLIPFLAAATSGIMLVACFPKLHLPGLVWVASLPLLWALARETRLKRAFLLGYVCGLFFFAGSCYWFIIVMEFYGHLSPWLSVLTLILFVLIDATFFGGFGLAMGWAARRSPGWALAASPFLWVAMELARTYLITGFPWNLLGYAVQMEGVRQIASVTGVYGLSFLAVVTSALMAWLVISRWRTRAGLALGIWFVCLLLAQWRLAPPPPNEGKGLAILIQPNVPLDDAELENWVPWRDPAQLRALVQFSVDAVKQFAPESVGPGFSPEPGKARPIQNSKFKIQDSPLNQDSKFKIQDSESQIENRQSTIDNPTLLVWAENPAPFFFTRDPVFRNAMENMARDTHTIVITNTIVPLDAAGNSITNTAITLGPDGREVSRYDKIHLVPFGEYVPWWALPGLVHKITSDIGNFIPGSSYPVARFPEGNVGVFICYEAIIPQLARHLVANGAGVVVNISNDAWYGDSAAAYQHLEMARLRAIENHRYLLRATNNGITTFIDPYGRVRETLPRYQRLALPAHFDYETRQTFYTKHGDAFAWVAATLGVLMLLGGAVKKGEG